MTKRQLGKIITYEYYGNWWRGPPPKCHPLNQMGVFWFSGCRGSLYETNPSNALLLREIPGKLRATFALKFVASEKEMSHICWWKRSCSNWYGKYPFIYMVLYIQTVLGNGISEPSTVSNLAKFLIFHQPRFPWNFVDFPFQNTTFWGEHNSCVIRSFKLVFSTAPRGPWIPPPHRCAKKPKIAIPRATTNCWLYRCWCHTSWAKRRLKIRPFFFQPRFKKKKPLRVPQSVCMLVFLVVKRWTQDTLFATQWLWKS